MKKMIVYTFGLAMSIFVALPGSAQQAPTVPFAQRQVTLDNGITGKPLTFESANPSNFEDIIGKATIIPIKLDGQLFVPAVAVPQAVVILAPGSGGVEPDHLNFAKELTSAGLAVFVMDPYTGRGIKDTISNQGQLSWAASVYDVLAVARMLATQPGIDGQRIGVLGGSRGGSAVLLAAHQQMTRAVLGEGKFLKAVLAGWPYCGIQFEHAITAPTAMRFLLGDSDNWVSPVQCQGQAAAMAATNPKVSVRFFEDAQHGFGLSSPIAELPNAIKAYNSPIFYLNDKGMFIDIYTGQPIPGVDNKNYVGRYAARWFARGASVGTKPGQKEAYLSDMVGFFVENLKR
jgi:dienelactone hydrolase